MKCSRAPLEDVTEGVDVTLVHIKECVGRELSSLISPRMPLMEGSVKLIFQVSTKCQIAPESLTMVITSATIGIGTWRFITPLPV